MIATKLLREVYRSVSLFQRFLGAHCQPGKLTPYDAFAVAFAVYAISQGRKPVSPEALLLLLQRHNGSIALESAPGRTVFEIKLPAETALT